MELEVVPAFTLAICPSKRLDSFKTVTVRPKPIMSANLITKVL